MDDLVFPAHARIAMARDQIAVEGVYHVIGDADEILPRDDGRTEYVGVWDGRTLMVVIEDDGLTVVTAFELKRRRMRAR